MPKLQSYSPPSSYAQTIRFIVAAIALCSLIGATFFAARAGLSKMDTKAALTSGSLTAADRAVDLTPSDPDAHYARALALSFNGEESEAVKEYEQAAALRPRDYFLWLSLGAARDEAGDVAGALTAFSEAVRLAPFYAETHWQLGNVLLRAGQIDEAFLEMRRAATSNPSLMPQLIDLAWTIYNGDVPSVEKAVGPQTSQARLALAHFAAKHGKTSDAAGIFRSIGHVSEDDRRAFLAELLAAKDFRAAYEVWAVAKKNARVEAGFTDGGFEEQVNLDESGFGWRIARDIQAVRVSIDNVQPHGGKSSLRVDWKGDANPSVPVIQQLVPVEPTTRYRLHFSARTDQLVTGGLPLLVITDASTNDSHELAHSDPLKERTSAWQDYSVEFTTGRETEAVVVALKRQNCSSNPCPIFGSLWLDDFSLEKL
ncbi:MAG TPA: tetratricopeptide repeat protein [Pyrinomonadaceae bacterium]|nr:tetratricopeptide repeat protein [Pyrinomonadaceae bacterium]